jgi:hypothetical protein
MDRGGPALIHIAAASQHRSSIAASSPQHRCRITSVLHHRATAALLVPCRTVAQHRRSAPHRSSTGTAAWCNTADRFWMDAASPQHHRTAAPPHRSIAAASLPHHFRTAGASPRRPGGAAPHRRAASSCRTRAAPSYRARAAPGAPPPLRRSAATPPIAAALMPLRRRRIAAASLLPHPSRYRTTYTFMH